MRSVTKRAGSSDTLIDDLSRKYIPYWPLLVMLLVPCIILAWVYLKIKSPVYEVTATIQVKDEKKGVDADQVTSSLNVLSSKSIVENEVEILHSKKFVEQAVKELHLYAPMYESGSFRTTSAYLTSPIIIEAEDPDNLGKAKRIGYSYNFNNKKVTILGKEYPIDQFVSTSFGRLKFSANPRFVKSGKGRLSFSLVKPDDVTEGVFAALDVSAVGKLSSIIKLKLKDEVPQRGEDIINTVIQKYNNATLDSKTLLAKNTMAFLDQRIARVVNDLNGVEGRVESYRTSKGVVNLTDQSRLYLQNVTMNDQKLADLNVQISVLEKVEQYVSSKDAAANIAPSTLGVNDETLNKLLEKYYDSGLQYEKLKETTGENNPALQSVRSQVNALRPAILENVRNQKINLEASRNNLNLTNNSYNAVLETIPAKERELINVSREQSTLTTLYNFLLQKREQAALAYSSSIAEIQIIDSAKASVLPVSPNKAFTYLAAFVLAVVCTVGYIIYRDILSNKILFRSDIEKNSIYPLLGEISYVKKGKEMLLSGSDFQASQDEFQQLNIAAGLLQRNNSIKRILVTSGMAGEGKSLIAANMALNLGALGKKVLLIDTDTICRQVSKTFHSPGNKGFSDFLSGKAELNSVIAATRNKNVSVITAGAETDIIGSLAGEKFEEMLNALSSTFDFIVIDSKPVSPTPEAYILSDLCDLTLYVVRHRVTPKEIIRKLDEVNELKPLKNLVLVFNGVKARGFILKTKHFGYGYRRPVLNKSFLSKFMLRRSSIYQKEYKLSKQL